MNIAVISNHETQVGLSSLVSMLATVYAKTQNSKVAIFTTGKVEDYFRLTGIVQREGGLRSANNTIAMLNGTIVKDEDLWDYGYRLGKEEAYVFDINSSVATAESKKHTFSKALSRINADMCIYEIKGRSSDPVNDYLISQADVILDVFATSPNSIYKAKNFKAKHKEYAKKLFFVCQKFDRDATSAKQLGSLLEVTPDKLYCIPYNVTVIKESMNGTLENIAARIMQGSADVVNIRTELVRLLKALYNDSKHKVIKEVSEWNK